MNTLLQASRLLRFVRGHLRHGELSREDLKVLRLQWTADKVECDWLMRKKDPWDQDIPAHVAREQQTLQALRDALNLRNAIFKSFPSVTKAELQMFDVNADGTLELLMSGSVARENEIYHRIPSIAMRALLCGFQFKLANGALERREVSGQSVA